MLVLFLILMGASAQGKTKTIHVSASGTKSKGTVKLEGSDYNVRMTDSVTLDSVYRYWNNFVTEHPKEERVKAVAQGVERNAAYAAGYPRHLYLLL